MSRAASSPDIFLRFETLRQALRATICDQDEAVDQVVDAFIHMACKPPPASPPKAIFFFLGPPHVGKGYLAHALAKALEGCQGFRQFDMSHYATPEDGARLLGQIGPEGISEGELTAFLKAFPKSVLLFSEIEKADNLLQTALLELITGPEADTGISCGETIVIFTTSLGSAIYRNRTFITALARNKTEARSVITEAIAREKKMVFDLLQEAIAPRLMSAMSQHTVVLFSPLSPEAMVRIGSASFEQFTQHFTKNTGIGITCEAPDVLVRLLVLSFTPRLDIGEIRQKLPDIVLDQITRFIRTRQSVPRKVRVRVSDAARGFMEDQFRKVPSDFAQQWLIRNETVRLTWKIRRRKDQVTLTLDHAVLKKLLPTKAMLREDLPVVEYSDTGFEDIAGNASIKKSLREIITVLKHPDQVRRFGISMPRGMLLHGPEGMGKTLLGRAFAREADLPFIYATGSQLFAPDYIPQIYAKARAFAPCIVFLDEIDTKQIEEGGLTPLPADQLVPELDAIPTDPDGFIFTVATAQDREAVLPVLTTPGRIDIFVEVPEFDLEARRFFIEKILEKPNDGKIDVDKVVHYISGMSGYDLERIGNEAALCAIRNNQKVITQEMLIEQINNIKYGYRLDKKQIRNLEEDLKKTACHEAAHAVLSYILMPHVKIEQVTIAPRYESLGFVSYSADDFIGNISKEEIFNNICVMLAGRAAQIRKFGPRGVDSGAVNDLEQATYLAYVAIASLGMDEQIGYVHVDTLRENVGREMFREKLEQQLTVWIGKAAAKAGELVEKYWKKIERVAEVLVRQEIVDGAGLDHIMKDRKTDHALS